MQWIDIPIAVVGVLQAVKLLDNLLTAGQIAVRWRMTERWDAPEPWIFRKAAEMGSATKVLVNVVYRTPTLVGVQFVMIFAIQAIGSFELAAACLTAAVTATTILYWIVAVIAEEKINLNVLEAAGLTVNRARRDAPGDERKPIQPAVALATLVLMIVMAYTALYWAMSRRLPVAFLAAGTASRITRVDVAYLAVTTISTGAYTKLSPLTSPSELAALTEIFLGLGALAVLGGLIPLRIREK